LIRLCRDWAGFRDRDLIGPERRNEAITALGNCLYEARLVGGIPEALAQSGDRAVQAVIEIDVGVRRPEFLSELFTGYYFAGALKEPKQNTAGLIL
jgi:hypothetical protein